MDGNLTISIGSILAVVGFLFQAGITIGAIAFSHGQLNQRVRAIEEKLKEHHTLATSVTRLETEMESVGREIKGLREDLKLLRFRPAVTQARRSPYDFSDSAEWALREDQ